MRFALFGNIHQAEKSACAERLLEALRRHGAELCPPQEAGRADMAISLGGDGTFLQAASEAGPKGIPILGINMGRLGFLADTPAQEIEAALADIHQGRYHTEPRGVLQLSAPGRKLKGCPYALNEIAVLKRETSSMITIHTHIGGIYLATYQADGLVISTPTGSTAYALSAGGPIVSPLTPVITLTPIAPHSLNMRPLVLAGDSVIELSVESRSGSFLIAADGRSEPLPQPCRLTIARAPYQVQVVKRGDQHFYATLRKKLMWGADVRQ